MIRILIAGVIAAVLAMVLMEKQVGQKGELKKLPADTAKQLDVIMEQNRLQKENALKDMGIN